MAKNNKPLTLTQVNQAKPADKPSSNTEMIRVMVEVDDESLDVAVARRTLVNLPESWKVEYFERGHHRIARSEDSWYHLVYLCEDPIIWMDEATFHGED